MKRIQRRTKKRTNTKSKTRKVFKKNDFFSSDGMLTSVWGPGMWHFLHTMSFNYPIHPTQKEKNQYRDYILNMREILPCKYCRINLINNLKEYPLTNECMKNRDTFSRYIYNLHELVNKMLKKKSNLTYGDVRERYEHFRARCLEEKGKIFKYVKTKTLKKNKHKAGCTEPLYGKKSKCIIKIVLDTKKTKSFQMDRKCLKKR